MRKKVNWKITMLIGLTLILGVFFTGCLGPPNGDENGLTFSLTVEVSGEGTVTPSEGTHHYEEETLVDLEAVPSAGYTFSQWEGDVADEDNSITTIWVDGDKSVRAIFVETETGGITHRVPEDFSTIQAAIDAADDDDTILVNPGTYPERIDFLGKNIRVISSDPEDQDVVAGTIISGDGEAGSLVRIADGVSEETVLAGFTITGAVHSHFNHGIGIVIVDGASPQIRNNIVTGNPRQGIHVAGGFSSPLIENNEITENENGGVQFSFETSGILRNNKIGNNEGPGIEINSGEPEIRNNEVFGNEGAGIEVSCFWGGMGESLIIGNIISDNTSDYRGGGIAVWEMTVTIRDNIIKENSTGKSGITMDNSGGGGINLIRAEGEVRNNEIFDNLVRGANSGTGGGIRVVESSLIIAENDISNNQAYMGGGIFLGEDSEAQIFNNDITSNKARFLGGGVYVLNEKGAVAMNEGGNSWPIQHCPPGTHVGNIITDNEQGTTLFDPEIGYNIRFESVD